MKNREAYNQIRSLANANGNILQDEKDTEGEIIRFYKKLLGSAATLLPCVQINTIRKGPTLHKEQQLQLIAPVTREEVIKVIIGIHDNNKALVCDGFSTPFSKKV